MSFPDGIAALPTFAALDAGSVWRGQRRGTSIQLDDTYFAGQLRALEAVETDATLSHRTATLTDARSRYEAMQVDVDELSEEALWDASERFRRRLRRLPEVVYLTETVPGQCFVVPEWFLSGTRLHYGARVYLFGETNAPPPADVLQANIEAVVADTFGAFERYQGRLHGYPDCCIDFYQSRSPDAPSPEWQAVEPFTDWIRPDAIGADHSMSIDTVLSPSLDREASYAFFAREFFPEPGCDTATAKGAAIYEALDSVVPEALVRDYFRLNFGVNYLVAESVHQGDDQRPSPGDLGREHLLFYLPLREILTRPRYT